MCGDHPDDGVADLAAGLEGQPLLHGGIIAGPRFIRHAQVGAQHVNTHLPVILPVISQARHRIHPGHPDGRWLLATQLLGNRVESFVQGPSALLCGRSVQLLALRLQRLVQLLALLSKHLFATRARRASRARARKVPEALAPGAAGVRVRVAAVSTAAGAVRAWVVRVVRRSA